MLDSNGFHHASGEVMGGGWSLRHRPVAGVDPAHVSAAALAALQGVDACMSTYRSDSELMALNHAPVGRYIPVSQELMTVIACADRIAARTDGAINVALGRLVNQWGFGPDPVPATRPVAEDTAAEALRSAQSYTLRDDPPAVLKHDDVAFDLCAIAKGYAVDRAAQAVRALGITDFLVEAAGEIVAQGPGPSSKGWTIGLELPSSGKEHLVYDEIMLSGAAATTGGYRNRREIAGETVSHTIDPRTGAPLVSDTLSVTVLHDHCMVADAWATALYVLGADDGPAFADAHGLAALFLIRVPDGLKEVRSRAFMERI